MIIALFDNPQDAAAAIHTMENSGVNAEDISIVASDSVSPDAFAIKEHSKLPEGVAIGSTSGAALGALIAGFTTVGALATGGAGLIVAGPLVAALAGAGAGAAGGAVVGGGIGAVIPEHELRHYQDAIDKGSVLVGVDCDSHKKEETKEICTHFDAVKITTS